MNRLPKEHKEVHCGGCGWWGLIDHLKPAYKSNPLQSEDVTPEPACPACLSDQWLEYKDDD